MTQVPIAMTYFGSDIWSYRRRTDGAILVVTVPETIITSAWRGEGRNTSDPKREISQRAVPTAIISMAQQASPKVSGHSELDLAQPISESSETTIAWPLRSVGTAKRDSSTSSAGRGRSKTSAV